MPTKEGTPTGPSDPRSKQSNPDNREHPARSYGGVDVNKSKKELDADAREAGIEGRSKMSKAELADAQLGNSPPLWQMRRPPAQ
jgi:hypothetical protein